MLTLEGNYYGNNKQKGYLRASQAENHAWTNFNYFSC